MNRVDDGRRRVEGVEGGSLRAVVLDGREQRLQFLTEGLPSGVPVPAGDRVGEDRESDGAKPGEPAKELLLLLGRGASFDFEGLERPDRRDDVAGLGLLAAGKELAERWSFVEISATLGDGGVLFRVRRGGFARVFGTLGRDFAIGK
ncbi:MAG: hypothetical protein ACLQGP_08220 [Isosphaeraceae bacterium]